MSMSPMLPAKFEDLMVLHRAYMPFLKYGGLFCETGQEYKMGDEVVLMITLPDKSKTVLSGEIAWINPKMGQRPLGVGVAFKNEDATQQGRHVIEKMLIGLPVLDKPYNTL